MRYRLLEKYVVKNELERPGAQEVGEGQQQSADSGHGEAAFYIHQMFANNSVEPTLSVLTHQPDTSTDSPNRCCASLKNSGSFCNPPKRMRLTERNARSANSAAAMCHRNDSGSGSMPAC